MRKLAEGYKRIRFLIEDGRDAETWTSTHVIAEVNSDGTILGRAFWPEYKAPARCFAEEPPPPPLVVDDVVEVIAENSRLQKQTRVVTRVYENGDVALGDVVFRPHEVRRIGHM